MLVPFTAQTRMSGMELSSGRQVRKGAADSVRRFVQAEGGEVPLELLPIVEQVSRDGATPLVVIDKPVGARVARAGRGAAEGHREARACASGSTTCA